MFMPAMLETEFPGNVVISDGNELAKSMSAAKNRFTNIK